MPGGSLAGFVQAREGGAPLAARVRLLTPDGQVISKRTRAPEAAEAAEALPVEAVTDARGFFQITELPPGGYRVLARSSGNESGGADAEVQEGAETRLDRSLVLAGPASVEISVDPPLHPSGNEWGVVLQGLDASAEGPGDISRVPASGLLRMDGVAEGNYLVLIVTQDQRWLAEEVEVHAPSTRLEFRVRAISLRGHLKLGNAPLAAQLVFGGKQGATRVDLTSNEEGLFEGYLPRAGDWPVEVEAEKPPVHRFLKRVVVNEGASGQYEVDLALPETHLAGEVVDSEFHPAPGAIVNVKSLSEEDRLLQTRVDSDGGFDVHGLPAGPALVSAVGPGEMGSDALTISIPQDGTASRVRLIVRPRKKLRGRIVMGDTGSPVAGAFAKVTPVGSVPAMSSRIAITDTEGRFETILPPGTREAEVTYGC